MLFILLKTTQFLEISTSIVPTHIHLPFQFKMANFPLEALFFFFLGSLVFVKHTRALIHRCLKSLKRRSSIVLLVHIATSIIEVLRYYERLAFLSNMEGFESDFIDVSLAILQTVTSFQLTQDRVFLGYRPVLRPVYHSQAILRLLFSIFAYTYTQPSLHKASIVINLSFIYPRIITYVARRLFVGRTMSHGNIHTTSVLLSALLAMHDTGFPLGPQVLLVCSAVFFWLEQWTARKRLQHLKVISLMSSDCQHWSDLYKWWGIMESWIVSLLCQFGIVETGILRGGWVGTHT